MLAIYIYILNYIIIYNFSVVLCYSNQFLNINGIAHMKMFPWIFGWLLYSRMSSFAPKNSMIHKGRFSLRYTLSEPEDRSIINSEWEKVWFLMVSCITVYLAISPAAVTSVTNSAVINTFLYISLTYSWTGDLEVGFLDQGFCVTISVLEFKPRPSYPRHVLCY